MGYYYIWVEKIYTEVIPLFSPNKWGVAASVLDDWSFPVVFPFKTNREGLVIIRGILTRLNYYISG